MCFSFKKRNQMEEITIWDSKKFNRSRCSVEIQQIKLKKYEIWKMCAPRNLHCNHHILSEYDSIEKVLIWKIALVSDHLVNFVIYRSIPLKADRVSLTIPANVSHFDVFNLLSFFSPSIHRLHGGKREKKNGPFVIFVSWTVICIIRGLSTGSHEQWCRCIMKMRTGSRERPWYSYHAPLVHYRCSNTFFKQRFLPLLLFSCQISCRAFHLRRRNEKRRKINENRLWITLKPLSRINISILIDIVEL